jgi:hypothetical protein
MQAVRVDIIRYTSDDQPGWVECTLVDFHGRRWSFIEKIPVVTEAMLGPEGEYPQPGVLACEVLERWADQARIDTRRPFGIESREGAYQFDVATSLLVEC